MSEKSEKDSQFPDQLPRRSRPTAGILAPLLRLALLFLVRHRHTPIADCKQCVILKLRDNIIGAAGRTPRANFLPGGTTNAALLNFTKGISHELAQYNVRINTARRTIKGYEVMHMLKKGQIKKVEKGAIRERVRFIAEIFGVVA